MEGRKGDTMRKIIDWNENWQFTTEEDIENAAWEDISLPHTWNAYDGQDGGGDYYQGIGWYRKRFTLEPGWKGVYVRFGAASKAARIICNRQAVDSHEGGFSAFTVNLTPYLLEGENELLVCVNNSNDLPIYPRSADFTFFGGLYRGAELICFDQPRHFDVTTYGTDAIFVSTKPDGRVGVIVNAPDGEKVRFVIRDAAGKVAASGNAVSRGGKAQAAMLVNDPLLWDGVDAPNLYTCSAAMDGDEISTAFWL